MPVSFEFIRQFRSLKHCESTSYNNVGLQFIVDVLIAFHDLVIGYEQRGKADCGFSKRQKFWYGRGRLDYHLPEFTELKF